MTVTQGSLTLTGLGGTYAISAFSYSASTFTAIWTLSHTISADNLNIDLHSSGTNAIRDSVGNALDGEWTNSTSSYPSGNGVAGGDFNFAFHVLPGDINQDGIVNGQDLALASSAWLTSGVTGDVNADGIVNGQDLAIISSQWLATLPGGGSQSAGSQDTGNQQATLLSTGQSMPYAASTIYVTIPASTMWWCLQSPPPRRSRQ